ncbi:MAG: VUT family protein, partial [Clostridiales bacterium]|nr:VUT family protein [Clostridiales bacterium]
MTNERIRRLKFLNAVTIIYVVLVICANVMASKVISISGVLTDAGTLTYPFTFMIGDILAEVFGYKAARRVILLGFAANLF